MRKELELWQFIHDRLNRGENVMLLVVAESTGSSPGRAGYKMAVAADGELCGSIGGGVMEVNLVEQSRKILSELPAAASGTPSFASPQVHRRNVEDSSGMICSGKQTVVFKLLTSESLSVVDSVIAAIRGNDGEALRVTPDEFELRNAESEEPRLGFEKLSEIDFCYEEKLGFNEKLYIIGGGHCALALSELMSKLDFRITIFDDRPDLNTIEKNAFADDISILDSYEKIGEYPSDTDGSYVVVMTLGYASDKVVIKKLIDRDFKYLGVLGSKAKMATLMKELKDEGVDAERLARIRTPIGIPINSHTPEEIAISIAAEIISVKNATK